MAFQMFLGTMATPRQLPWGVAPSASRGIFLASRYERITYHSAGKSAAATAWRTQRTARSMPVQ